MSNTDAVVETIVSSDDTVRVEVVDQEKAAVSKHEPKPDPLDAEKVELLSNGWAKVYIDDDDYDRVFKEYYPPNRVNAIYR